MTDAPIDRQAVHAELESARAVFAELVARAGPRDLRRASDGTRWTNRQLLFHMLFGYLIVRALLPLVRVFGRLPDQYSRRYAAVLNAGTRPFHTVNYLGSCCGALTFRGPRLVAGSIGPSRLCTGTSMRSRRRRCGAACGFRWAGTPTSRST